MDLGISGRIQSPPDIGPKALSAYQMAPIIPTLDVPGLSRTILSYLNPLDLQRASSVSLSGRSITSASVKEQELTLIKSLASSIAEKLGEENPKKVELLRFINTAQLSPSFELNAIRRSILKLRESLITILKDLPSTKLAQLEVELKQCKKPLTFEEIFYLAIAAKIPADSRKNYYFVDADTVPEEPRNTIIAGITRDLWHNGDHVFAIKIANLAANVNEHRNALMPLIAQIIETGSFSDILEILHGTKLPIEHENSVFIKHVFHEMIQFNPANINAVIRAANTFTGHKKDAALFEIYCFFSENGFIEKAIQIAKGTSTHQLKAFLKNLFKQLVTTPEGLEFVLSLRIIDSIPHFIKDSALEILVLALGKIGNIDRAIAILKTIEDENAIFRACRDLIRADHEADALLLLRSFEPTKQVEKRVLCFMKQELQHPPKGSLLYRRLQKYMYWTLLLKQVRSQQSTDQ